MLAIREDQLIALDGAMKERFAKRAMDELMSEYPDRFPGGAEEAGQLVDEGLEEAKEWGMCTEDEALAYLKVRCVCGPGFVESGDHPRESWVLKNDGLTSDRKRMMLESLVAEQAPSIDE